MRKPLLLLALTILFSLAVRSSPIHTVTTADIWLTTAESQMVGMVNGTSAYEYDLELERIAYSRTLSNYSFRAGGSSGANAAADWLMQQFEALGLEAYKEQYQFTDWEVVSRPQLIIDDDGNSSTTNDQTRSMHSNASTTVGLLRRVECSQISLFCLSLQHPAVLKLDCTRSTPQSGMR